MLTKSLFNLAVKCPTKLYYKTNNYPSLNSNDEFLKALAAGGFQVGELARCYFPDGILITKENIEDAVVKTNELLERENVIIFEAAFKYNNLFAKIDILVKQENEIKIYEVKSKSIDTNVKFLTTKDKPISKWKKYFYDLAFQKYIVSKYPSENFTIKSFLYLANKDAKTSIDGLNQKFTIKNKDGFPVINTVGDFSLSDLGDLILIEKDFSEVVNNIISGGVNKDFLNMQFENFVNYLSEKITANEKIVTPLGSKCETCEFKSENSLSGYGECWESIFAENNTENENNLIYNIWDYRITDKEFANGKYFMSQLDLDQFSNDVARQKRQLLQVKSVLNNSTEEYLNIGNLKSEFESWTYPLHMIDFETSRVAVPFLKDKSPYQVIAYQFSHHIINADGSIEHKGEFLMTDPGDYPNFEFLRQLKNQLDTDSGTVFMYHHYERDVLNSLKEELENCTDSEVDDKQDLINWIQTLTTGERCIVDLLKILMKYYYNPRMKGSNSLKVVLPSILNSSDEIKEKYNQPIYGTDEMKSKNFENHKWIEFNEEGEVKDPYELLEKFKYDLSEVDEERIFKSEGIFNGGSAMVAYNQMQFTEMTDIERDRINKALLQYCELDTFAMVLLVEYWKNKIYP